MSIQISYTKTFSPDLKMAKYFLFLPAHILPSAVLCLMPSSFWLRKVNIQVGMLKRICSGLQEEAKRKEEKSVEKQDRGRPPLGTIAPSLSPTPRHLSFERTAEKSFLSEFGKEGPFPTHIVIGSFPTRHRHARHLLGNAIRR